jgi:hypothetical protein
MARFLFTYRMPDDAVRLTPESQAAWQGFFDQLGVAVVDGGKPIFSRADIGDCGAARAIGGYSIVEAEDLEAASVLAKACPFVGAGGGVEIGELGELPGA